MRITFSDLKIQLLILSYQQGQNIIPLGSHYIIKLIVKVKNYRLIFLCFGIRKRMSVLSRIILIFYV